MALSYLNGFRSEKSRNTCVKGNSCFQEYLKSIGIQLNTKTLVFRNNPYGRCQYQLVKFFLNSFNYIRAWNEYQDTGNVTLHFNKYIPSNLKRKFRIWRANIPRDSTHKRDRIRNTWANITLKASSPNTTKTELHDLIVNYFM